MISRRRKDGKRNGKENTDTSLHTKSSIWVPPYPNIKGSTYMEKRTQNLREDSPAFLSIRMCLMFCYLNIKVILLDKKYRVLWCLCRTPFRINRNLIGKDPLFSVVWVCKHLESIGNETSVMKSISRQTEQNIVLDNYLYSSLQTSSPKIILHSKLSNFSPTYGS